MAEVVVLDSSALIALVSSSDPHHKWALEMFRDTASFDLQMTALSQVEALVHPARNGKLDKLLKTFSALALVVTSFDSSDASKLATLRATTTLTMSDACVLLQAMKVKGSIATTDNQVAQAAKSKGVGVFSPK